jgi:predicted alpha/beta superfamily hydrolase
MYFGHSQGGLFGTHVMFTAPTTFRRYGIASPSLWWNGDLMFEREASYSQTHDDLTADVFFAVGGDEDHVGRQREASRLAPEERAKAALRHLDMVADTERMVTALQQRRYPSLRLGSVVIPQEFHTTVAHTCLSRALRFLFDAPS